MLRFYAVPGTFGAEPQCDTFVGLSRMTTRSPARRSVRAERRRPLQTRVVSVTRQRTVFPFADRTDAGPLARIDFQGDMAKAGGVESRRTLVEQPNHLSLALPAGGVLAAAGGLSSTGKAGGRGCLDLLGLQRC